MVRAAGDASGLSSEGGSPPSYGSDAMSQNRFGHTNGRCGRTRPAAINQGFVGFCPSFLMDSMARVAVLCTRSRVIKHYTLPVEYTEKRHGKEKRQTCGPCTSPGAHRSAPRSNNFRTHGGLHYIERSQGLCTAMHTVVSSFISKWL